ncbi:cytochrome C oxidase subunit IV family protein [Longimicrobium sp.]|uniref:cytochrome C oxidase subunit IV family protein n=1 Tax=Longimicrobium sp. TaxID=2029185 RepID=UPI002BB1B5C8|nr:cytochrome C oxidase subunit IV family protein [Longimicrobium sp.]HSU16759.1 cytochrome C oxidase subunit IV family protein [Longimicrobium sp.]
MTSETREIVHDQHSHPGLGFYMVIGGILIGFTVLEILGYIGETKHMYSSGTAAAIILVLSAVKFFSVVAYYMHLKFDNKLFTGIFVFPAVLGTLVIGGMILLFHVVHGEATQIHGEFELNAQKPTGVAAPAAH